MPSFKRPIGASGVALAMALVAAACSSGSTDTTATGASETAATAAETTAAPATNSDSTESDGEAGDEPEAEPEEAAESEGPSPVIEHSFPDLNTVTIADGTTVNLADELAGGDTPILLWFFAPH